MIPEAFIKLAEDSSGRLGYPFHTGRVATGDFFLNDSKRKQEITDLFNPVAYDMESAAIAHVCADKKVAFAAVRTLSDLADDNAHIAVKEPTEAYEVRPVQVVWHAIHAYLSNPSAGGKLTELGEPAIS